MSAPTIRLASNPAWGPAQKFFSPTVRLAHCPGAQGDNNLLRQAPSVRLSVGGGDKKHREQTFRPVGAEQADSAAPAVRLAVTATGRGDRNLTALADEQASEPVLSADEVRKLDTAPAILVSYYYLQPFMAKRADWLFRDWALDSGAFSAFNSGVKIDLNKYIDDCLKLMETDKQLVEIFALDVIGDHEASLRNAEEMWRQGVPAIPAFHNGSPWEVLVELAKKYPKIGIGGMRMLKGSTKHQFIEQVFARVWPKKLHGFAIGSKETILRFPWHSVDATNWEIGPCAFGAWQYYNRANLRIRGCKHNLRSEIEFYLKIEREARVKWGREMALLEKTCTT